MLLKTSPEECVAECGRLASSSSPLPAPAFLSLCRLCEPHLAAPDVAIAMCNALADVCERDDANRFAAGVAVVPFLLRVMQGNPTLPALQIAWCRAVRWLSGGATIPTANMEAIAALEAGGVVSLLLPLLRSSVGEEMVQRWGLAAIFALARADTTKRLLVSSGSLECVNAAVDTWPASTAVCEWACRALVNTCSGSDPVIQEVLGRVGVLSRILRVLKDHRTNETIVMLGVWALNNSNDRKENSAASLNAGALQVR